MLTCRELLDFLLDYHEGRLDPGVHERFEEHLAVCPRCGAYLESDRHTRSLARLARREPLAGVPEEVPAELVRAVLAARPR